MQRTDRDPSGHCRSPQDDIPENGHRTDSPIVAEPFTPLVERLQPAPRTEELFARLRFLPHCVFLDSALRHEQLGRYSFLAADPFDYMEVSADGTDGLGTLQKKMSGMCSAPIPGLPPFQGGAAGLFSYDLHRSLERIHEPRFDEFQLPSMAIGLYDVVVAVDHVLDQAWIISQGLPETAPPRRRRRAARRLGQFRAWLCESPSELQSGHQARMRNVSAGPLDPDRLAPQYHVQGTGGLTSNFSKEAYLRAVEDVQEYICAGDVFQVNLAQRLLCPAYDDAASLYLRLRERNPAPFAGYFDLGHSRIASASPERFLQVRDGCVEARPIKGTRQRTAQPEADLFAAADLERSEKDRAENVMIVDLLRNDLSRVCTASSVSVTQLCQLETYQFVQHLVSSVEGRLRKELTSIDAVRAAFPGGSITGAPKVRAMEIIAELEPTARGPYCGSLGYLGFDGQLDLSILIRTITAAGGWWQLPVGGGIVAQSVPEREYEETWHKAEGMIRALRV